MHSCLHVLPANLPTLQSEAQKQEQKRAAAQADAAYAHQLARYLRTRSTRDLQRQKEKRDVENSKVQALNDKLTCTS